MFEVPPHFTPVGAGLTIGLTTNSNREKFERLGFCICGPSVEF